MPIESVKTKSAIEIERPQGTQLEFFKAQERYIAFGGARGGGKSWAVRGKAVRLALFYAGIRIIIIRRTLVDLRDNHINPLKAQLLRSGRVNYVDREKVFIFDNGSTIRCNYFDNESDEIHYQGQEYDVIFLEEATQFLESTFNVLKACLRGANTFPKRFYITCNPGGVGHTWVKRLFVDRQYNETEKAENYRFIQSKVYDNKILMDNNPEYIEMLESLPAERRKAWLNGDWDSFEGQYFHEFNRDIHVVEPFEIPSNWKRYTTMDYGLDMLAWYDVAVSEDKEVYFVNEIYKKGKIVSDAADLIRSTEPKRVATRFAPPDLWNTQSATGKSTAILFGEKGLQLAKSNNDRIAGWLAIKEMLKIDEKSGKPQLRIFRNCTNLIRCLPLLQFDDKTINDCATEPHEITHACDAARYFAISHISPPRRVVKEEKKHWRSDWFEDYTNAKTEEERILIKEKYGEPNYED